MKPSGPGLLWVGSFLITASILSAVIGLFRLSSFLHSVLEDKFLGIELFIVISLNPLVISVVLVLISPFSFDFIYLGPLSFSLDEFC